MGKKVYFILLIILLSYSTSIAATGPITKCITIDSEYYVDDNGTNFKVYNQEAQYKGYVTESKTEFGVWSAWIDGIGSGNSKFNNNEDAIDYVCSPPQENTVHPIQ